MSERKERPGVTLYFDTVRPAMTRMDGAQCGALLRAVMDYAQYGVAPALEGITGMAFDMLVPRIDQTLRGDTGESAVRRVHQGEGRKGEGPFLKPLPRYPRGFT